MTEDMIKYLLDNAVDGQFVVITDYENEQNVICKDGRFSFELEDAIAIRDDRRELYMGSGAEVNVYMVYLFRTIPVQHSGDTRSLFCE